MSEQVFCGLDFGTSNSTLGLMNKGKAELVALEGKRSPSLPLYSSILRTMVSISGEMPSTPILRVGKGA